MYKQRNMPHQSFINSDESTAGLILSWFAAGTTYLMRWMNMETINSGLVLATTVLAVVFTIFKIRGQRLDNESKRLDNEIKRRKLKDDENN